MESTKTINFGSHSSCTLVFDNQFGTDTKVSIQDQNEQICWINANDIENFTNDFEQLLKKYFI